MKQDKRFSVKASADASYLTIELDEMAEFDELAIKMLREDRPEFLLPFQIKTINDQQQLRYKLINAVSLKYSCDKSMSKHDHIELALDLITPFITCKDWFLDYHYICLDKQFILYDRRRGGYSFVYMPEASLRNTDDDIVDFFESVLNYIDITDDREYQIKIMHYFRDRNVTLSELYDLLISERGQSVRNDHIKSNDLKKVSDTEPDEPSTPVRVSPEKEQPANDTIPESDNIVSDNGANSQNNKGFFGKIFGRSKDTGKSKVNIADGGLDDLEDIDSDFNEDIIKKPTKEKKTPKIAAKKEIVSESVPKVKKLKGSTNHVNSAQNIYVDNNFTSDATNIGTQELNRKYLELVDSCFDNVPREFSLETSKEYLTVGRISSDSAVPDIAFPENCKGVSREHARIIFENDSVYIIDLGSTYFTLLDDKRLVPNNKEELIDGMTVTFVAQKPIRYRVHIPRNNGDFDF